MDNGDEIYQLTKACSDLFTECQLIAPLTQNDWIENKLGDFNLWSVGIRASSTGHSSLDYRVRDRPDIKGVIVGLLDGIKSALAQCLAIGKVSSSEEYLMRLMAVCCDCRYKYIFVNTTARKASIKTWKCSV